MHLLPRETDKLTLHSVGSLAQKRLARGVKLNAVEATALIASQVLIRDGKHSVAQLMSIGRQMLGFRHVQDGASCLLHDVQVEGTFPDGTKLVTIHNPICSESGDLVLALYGSFLPVPSNDLFPMTATMQPMAGKKVNVLNDSIGEIITLPGTIAMNIGKERTLLLVINLGDRPIQVGSHYPFLEINAMLQFDRALAYGKRLDIAPGTSVRFEPGDRKYVNLIPISGTREIYGGNGLASGPVSDNPAYIARIVESLVDKGFKHMPQVVEETDILQHTKPPFTIPRSMYAAAYGPTTGDRIRLGDTNICIEIERDYATYGDEIVFGGGKVIREGMGQSTGVSAAEALDLVITNVVILDWTGIYKADIGIKGGLICGIGRAGNPHIMCGIDPCMIVGVTTEVIAGEGCIVTAGAIDSHIHFICPQLCTEALSSGTTTLIGGGTGPATGTKATTCTPGKHHIELMLRATDGIPVNIGLTGKGNSSSPVGLVDQIRAGAIGLKLHEDWGSSPQAIDACLRVCNEYDVQATLHSDTLNETGFVESTIAAFQGRTIHAYHIEGAGGGHAPDCLRMCSLPNVIPSSTNPTRPYTVNTLDEHLDMLMVCHHLSRDIPEDIAFAGETIGAEDHLHDIGAISIISSDSQAMGRVGEVIQRTWQTCHKNKQDHISSPHPSTAFHDNIRAKRYVSKYTINSAIVHGISGAVGSIEVGKLADLIIYNPKHFGTRPELVLKGGFIAYAQMGDANGSIPNTQPVKMQPMFGTMPATTSSTSIVFVSKLSIAEGSTPALGLTKKLVSVEGCRCIGKRDMKWNDALPKLEVDAETYIVKVDGRVLDIKPASVLPLSQSVFLF